MTVFNSILPVIPGKEDVARAWINELSGRRKDGFNELQRRSEITRETFTLQATPNGSVILVWFDGNIEKASSEVATASYEFALWHRARLEEVTGLKLSEPDDGPPPELLLDWRA